MLVTPTKTAMLMSRWWRHSEVQKKSHLSISPSKVIGSPSLSAQTCRHVCLFSAILAELTSTSLTGPISFSRLFGSTGTAGKTSVLSAPSLCWESFAWVTKQKRTYVKYIEHNINQNINIVTFRHWASLNEFFLGTPPSRDGTFLVEFTKIPLQYMIRGLI